MNTNNKLRIAIDGGASTGKSTVARMLAEELGIELINTGTMYRYITYYAIENNLLGQWKELVRQLREYKVTYSNGILSSTWKTLDHNKLHSDDIASHVSDVSTSLEVREYASSLQKEIASKEGVLLEGRDIGTIIMPDADYKFFLTVSDEEAANRRFKEYQNKGIDSSYEEVLSNVKERNKIDSNRAIAPLKKADDAIEVDTSGLDQYQVVAKIMEYING